MLVSFSEFKKNHIKQPKSNFNKEEMNEVKIIKN